MSKKFLARVNMKLMSSIAILALYVSAIAANQRCWYVMYEETMPEGCKKLKRF